LNSKKLLTELLAPLFKSISYMKKAPTKILIIAIALFGTGFFYVNAQNIGTIEYRPGYSVNQITNHPANVIRPYYIQCPVGYRVQSIYANVRRANAGSMNISLYYPGGNTATTSISNTQTGYNFVLPNIPCEGGTASSTTTGIPIYFFADQLLAITEWSPFLGFPSTSTLAIIGTTTDRWLLAGITLTLPLTISTSSSDMSTSTISGGLQNTTDAVTALTLVLAVLTALFIAVFIIWLTRYS